MKITNEQLKQIIKEELEAVLSERGKDANYFLNILKQDAETQEIDDAIVRELFSQLPVKAEVDPQGGGKAYYIDYGKDPRAKIAAQALNILKKSGDGQYDKHAARWKGSPYGASHFVFQGTEEELIANAKALMWPVKVGVGYKTSKDREQNITYRPKGNE